MKPSFKFRNFFVLIITTFIFFQPEMNSALGQNKQTKNKSAKVKKSDWKFVISPYALLAAQSTDVGTTQLRQSFSDLSSLVNFGLQLAGTVAYKFLI